MKPSKRISGKNYGSIGHLSGSKLGAHDRYIHFGQERIVLEQPRDRHDRIVATLKLDGTNVGIVRQGKQLYALQRKGYDCQSSPYEQHHRFADWVKERYAALLNALADGQRLVGEWCWQASGIRYRIAGEPFFAFDLFDVDGKRVGFDEMQRVVHALELASTPLLWDSQATGQPLPLHEVWATTPSIPAIQALDDRHEGMVVRVERRGTFDFMAKWVRADYQPGKFLPGLGLSADAPIVINKFI